MPRACIIYAGTEFVDSARAVKTYLEANGFSVHMANFDFGKISDLPAAPGGCDISLWLSHGGWDGPMVFDEAQTGEEYTTMQVDPSTPEPWERLKTWVKSHIRPGGMLISHSCHSAGSNRYEDTSGEWAERWVQQIAQDMNVYAVGVEGSTASANRYDAVAFLKYALQGQRWKQASRAYRPGGQRETNWSGWLNQ